MLDWTGGIDASESAEVSPAAWTCSATCGRCVAAACRHRALREAPQCHRRPRHWQKDERGRRSSATSRERSAEVMDGEWNGEERLKKE